MQRKASGFTLMEMLVVLVIIGLVASLVGPKIFGQADRARTQTAETQIDMLKGTLQLMRLDIGRFPSTEEGLRLLNTAPTDPALKARWKGPYLDKDLPKDPWGRDYRYSTQASSNLPFSLFTYGEDDQPGGEGVNADAGYLPK